MEFRKAKQGDCKQVWEMCKIPELINPSGQPPRLWWIKDFVKEKQIFFVAEENKEIIGFVLGERITGNCAIAHMSAVKKQYQGQGIGTELINLFEKECKKRKLKAILTYAYSKSKSVKILEKRGYEKGFLTYEMLKFLE